MTDRQKLIYDLSLQCAVSQVSPDAKNVYLAKAVLDAFTANVHAYQGMAPDALDAALDELKKVQP